MLPGHSFESCRAHFSIHDLLLCRVKVRHFAFIAVLMGEKLIPGALPHFSLFFRLLDIESDVFYEKDKGKIQANCEILARKL